MRLKPRELPPPEMPNMEESEEMKGSEEPVEGGTLNLLLINLLDNLESHNAIIFFRQEYI